MHIDRTSEFAECVQARRRQTNTKTPSAEILRPRRRRTLFIRFAQDVMQKVELADEGVHSYEKEVQQARRTALQSMAFAAPQENAKREQEIDLLENDTRALLAQCMQLIEKVKSNVDVLGNALEEDASGAGSSKQRAREKVPPPNPTISAHRYGVVLYLNERLQAATRAFERARAARLEAIASSSRRRTHRTRQEEAAAVWKSLGVGVGGGGGGGAREAAAQAAAAEEEARAARELEASLSADQRRVLQEENERIFHDFTSLNEQVRAAERKVAELARLQRLFGLEVARQAGDIERLYDAAVATCEDLSRGNKELRKAAERGTLDLRSFTVFFVMVMALALLFLDWYSG